MSTTPIIITLPKYVSTANSNNGSTFKDFVDANKMNYETALKGRKRRLDHLTWEEKLQRKKLKNRVAAQTSRDRKKQKMEEMDGALKELMDKNEELMAECIKLRSTNKKLMSENVELKRQSSSSTGCCQCRSVQNSSSVNCSLSNGSAASELHPLPQGQRLQLAAVLDRRQTTMVILKIVLAYLLCQTSSPISTQNLTLTNWKNSLKAFSKISPLTWKRLLQKDRTSDLQQNNARQMVGQTSEHMESSRNESLTPILTDHQYHQTNVFSDQQQQQLHMTKSTSISTKTKTPTPKPIASSPKRKIDNHQSKDTFYATINDTDNCVTIVVSDDSVVPISEAVTEVVTSEPESKNLAQFVSTYTVDDEDLCDGYLKPERALSDCGYESLGSPHSESSDVEMSELWNQSFTELFPNLM